MRADFGRFRGWTCQDFRNLVHERFIAAGGAEEECGARRMHQAALNWMGYARSVDDAGACQSHAR